MFVSFADTGVYAFDLNNNVKNGVGRLGWIEDNLAGVIIKLTVNC